MKKSKIIAVGAICALSAALAVTATACSSTVGTNISSYFSQVSRVLELDKKSSTTTTVTQKTPLSAPASFSVSDGKYTIAAVEGASSYLLTAKSGEDEYTGVATSTSGTITDDITLPYGEYSLTVVAIPSDSATYTISEAVSASGTYTVKGELPAPQYAYKWDGKGSLSLQFKNSSDYTSTVSPDKIVLTLTPAAGEAIVKEFSELTDQTVEVTAGTYTVTAYATSSSAYVTAASSSTTTIAENIEFGGDEVKSDNYSENPWGGGGGGGGFANPSGTFTFASDSTEIAFTASYAFELKAKETTEENVAHYYAGADTGNGGAGGIACKLYLYTDGTLGLSLNGGPFNTTINGTWTEADGQITITF